MHNQSELASSLRDADSLLTVLETAGHASEETVADLKRVLRDRAIDQSVINDLVEELAHWPVLKQEQQTEAFEAWLRNVERLGFARRGMERLGALSERVATVRTVLTELLEHIRSIVERKPDRGLLAGLAEEAMRGVGVEKIEPWMWFQGGELLGALQADPELLEPTLQRWVTGRLHATDAKDLRALVESKEEVREAYGRHVRELTKELYATRWNPQWSLDVATSTEELQNARRLLFVLLPHSGRRLDVRQHCDGTWWTFSEDICEGELVPWEHDYHLWRDDLLGEVRTLIHSETPPPELDVWHGLESLRLVGAAERFHREDEIAQSFARDLENGVLGNALYAGCDAFSRGFDTSRIQDQLVQYALEARLLLSRAASLLAAAGGDVTLLSAAVRGADEAHRNHGKALHLLDERTYERIVEGIPLDEDEWWGARERLDRVVPLGVAEGALRGDARVRKSADVIRFPVSQTGSEVQPTIKLAAATAGLARHLEALVNSSKSAELLFAIADDLERTPCPWLYGSLRTALERVGKSAPQFAPTVAEMMGPSPGRVPILLYDQGTNSGFVGELWIRNGEEHDIDDTWREAQQLRSYARDVIRRAFFAAGAFTPCGIPPRAFGDHKIALKIPESLGDGPFEVDGSSLGLSAALAFASLWTKVPIPSDVVATASVRGNTLGPVYGVEAKAKAVAALAGDRPIRLFCHPVNERDAYPIAIAVETLEEVLRKWELNLGDLDRSLFGSVNERSRELLNLVNDVKIHYLDRERGRATWLDVADTMRRLIFSLYGQPGAPGSLQECSCYAALAYIHAGDVESASALLQSVTEVNDLPLNLRALHSIVQLGLHVDCGTLETEAGRTECGRLETIISELRGSDTQGLLGRCAGTLGRALMHEYRLDKALPLLRSAVEYHGTTELLFERARSRIYLAMALRMDGKSEEAFGQVKLAEKDLEQHTRPFSAEYARSCGTYLLYEKARTLASMGRLQEAVDATDMALLGCEYQWWPELGILRTRAWALRGLLREREADACVERMVAVRRNLVPPGQLESMIDGLIEESKGDGIEGGIVY